jgi:hypothetical protein
VESENPKRKSHDRSFVVYRPHAYPAAVAHADDTAEEIRLLKAQLKKLEEKVNAQDRERKAAEAQIRKAAAQQQPGAPANAPPILTQEPNYGIPKIPGSPDQRVAVYPSMGIGLPPEPPSGNVWVQTGLTSAISSSLFSTTCTFGLQIWSYGFANPTHGGAAGSQTTPQSKSISSISWRPSPVASGIIGRASSQELAKG